MKPHHLLLTLFLLVSCTNDLTEVPTAPVPEASASGQVSVTLTTTFTDVSLEPLTRATAASDGVSRLVLSIFDADGKAVNLTDSDTPVTQLTQAKDDTGFGTFTGIRLAPGTYHFVCVGHKCGSAETGYATITSPTSVTLPDPAIYSTYSLVKDVTITPSATMQQDVAMELAASYSQLTLTTKDNITPATNQLRLTLNPSGTETTTYTLNPTTHLTTGNIKTVITYDISKNVGQTETATIKFLLPASPQHYTLVVETLDASNNILTTRTFDKDQDNNDILYYLGRTTVIRTNLFTTSGLTTITLEDWGSDNTYNID